MKPTIREKHLPRQAGLLAMQSLRHPLPQQAVLPRQAGLPVRQAGLAVPAAAAIQIDGHAQS